MVLINNQKILLLYWLGLSALILITDYLTGPLILFPILYLIPVILVSWYNGRRWGVLFALAMSLIRLYFSIIWPAPWPIFISAVNTVIRIVVLVSFAYLVDKIANQKRELEKEVHNLQGLLPICSFCKKIRDQDGNWEVLEQYIMTHSEAEFSHGMCPECARQHYPEYYKE